MKQIISIFLSLIFGLYAGVSFAASQTSIGMVTSTTGNVFATGKQNKQRVLKRRSLIYLNDRIKTQQKSKARLKFDDDSIIIMQPSSEFYISKFAYNKKSRNNECVGNIVKGALISISGQGKNQLNSPIAGIDVRGTIFSTRLFGNKGGLPISQDIFVIEGSVTAKNICERIVGDKVIKICDPRGARGISIGAGETLRKATIFSTGVVTPYKAQRTQLKKMGRGEIAIGCR